MIMGSGPDPGVPGEKPALSGTEPAGQRGSVQSSLPPTLEEWPVTIAAFAAVALAASIAARARDATATHLIVRPPRRLTGSAAGARSLFPMLPPLNSAI